MRERAELRESRMTNAVVVVAAASIGPPGDPVQGTAESREARKMKQCMAAAAA